MPRPLKNKWFDRYYIEIYELALLGKTNRQIAKELGFDDSTFDRWRDRKPDIDVAINKAREKIKGSPRKTELANFVYGRLPPHLKELWEKLDLLNEADGPEKVDLLFRNQGKDARQQLFIHALLMYSFNASLAMNKLGVTSKMLKLWMEDPDFLELVKEIEIHKGNFYESCLIDKAAEGDTQAIIFANKTFNRNRGYGEVREHLHNHTGTFNHIHAHVSLSVDPEELNLPLEVSQLILSKLEEHGYKKREVAALEDKRREAIEVEVVNQSEEF